MQKGRVAVGIAWALCALVCAWSLFAAWNTVAARPAGASLIDLLVDMNSALFPLFFAIPATLIITRQPRHTIGWLLMIPTLTATLADMAIRYLAMYPSTPPPATALNLAVTWFAGVAWLPMIFPLLLFPLLFPTGRPPSPGWRWPIFLAVAMTLVFLVLTVFQTGLPADDLRWTLRNPIGLLPEKHVLFQVFLSIWGVLLLVLTLSSLTAFFARFRRASIVEREQMKWLLYACALFGVVYTLGVIENTDETRRTLPWILPDLINLLLGLAITAIPAATAIAILRYRLFDIDVIIRLTLVYTLVTGLLAALYIGGVILLQEAFRSLTGQRSDAAVVVATLAIAALFNPLRQRVQAAVNRRFYRQNYNAEQAFAQFTAVARSSSDLEALTSMLEEVVQANLQPTRVSLMMTPIRKEKHE